MDRVKLLKFFIITFTIVVVIFYPMEYQEKYKTNPTHPLDGLVWGILDKIALNDTTGKISHPWHWRILDLNPNWTPQTFPGDNTAKKLENTQFIPGLGYISLDGLKRSYGSWNKVVLLEPNDSETWHYVVPDLFNPQTKVIRCSIKLSGPVRVLLGPDPFVFYGLNSENNQINLKVSGPFERDDKSIRKYPLI